MSERLKAIAEMLYAQSRDGEALEVDIAASTIGILDRELKRVEDERDRACVLTEHLLREITDLKRALYRPTIWQQIRNKIGLWS